MSLSINEIEATALKAATAAGVMAGQAEDTARACGWLATNGYDAAAALVAATALSSPPPSPPQQLDDGSWVFNDAHAAICGVAAMDLILTPPPPTVRLLNIDSPLLLFGIAAVVAATYQTAITLNLSNGGQAIGTATVAMNSVNGIKADDLSFHSGCDIIVRQCADMQFTADDANNNDDTRSTVALNRQAWAQIERLAARRLVPSSALSRSQGAGGATLTDND